MSYPPRVLCRVGCGDYGDPDLNYLCGDCHADQLVIKHQRALFASHSANVAGGDVESSSNGDVSEAMLLAVAPRSSTRRDPPSIDHRRSLEVFLARPREKDREVIERECMFLEREREIRDTGKVQLRKYMIATEMGESVDTKDWGRYQFGAPRDIPRSDVSQAVEIAAQTKLFCCWRRRTLNKRIATRRQLLLDNRDQSRKGKNSVFVTPKLSAIPSIRSRKTSTSARVLSGSGTFDQK